MKPRKAQPTRTGTLHANTKPQSEVRGHVQPGLKALEAIDKPRISPSTPSYVSDSLALDEMFRPKENNSARWDYWLGTTDSGLPIIAVEVHSAKPSEVKSMIQKKAWAMQKAKDHLRDPSQIKKWFWIASKSTQIPPTTAEYRSMSQAGICLVGSTLHLPPKSK